MKINLTLGRLFLGTAIIASGVQQVIRQDFVRLVPKLPAWLSGGSWWAILSGILLVAVGAAIMADWKRKPAAIIAGALFVVVLALYLPGLMANPRPGFMWTNPCKTLALIGGAIFLANQPSDEKLVPTFDKQSSSTALMFCTISFGLFLAVCGVQHFVYADFAAQLIPPWIPGHLFWTYLTGTALVAGGVGIVIPTTARLAALMSGVMIFLWIVLLHIPRALTIKDAGETAAIFEALALSGVAFLLATKAHCKKSICAQAS